MIAAVGLALAFVLPDLLTISQCRCPTAAPIALSIAVCSASGIALGTAFPAGMRLVRTRYNHESPWPGGINGVGSVVASSLAVIVALDVGLHWLFVLAACCYAALVPLTAWMRGRPSSPRP